MSPLSLIHQLLISSIKKKGLLQYCNTFCCEQRIALKTEQHLDRQGGVQSANVS